MYFSNTDLQCLHCTYVVPASSNFFTVASLPDQCALVLIDPNSRDFLSSARCLVHKIAPSNNCHNWGSVPMEMLQ
jgi:hypothetical protein